MPTFTLAELANLTNCQLDGEYDCAVHSVASLPSAQTGQLAFLNTKDFRQYLPDTKASAVILKPGDAKNCPCNALITSNPSLAYAKAAEALHPLPKKSPGIHPSAVIGSDTSIDPSVAIGPHCTIGDKVVIEAGVNIGPNCIIEDHCHIQQDSRLLANVTLLNQTRLGQRCLIHSGAVIGSDGFGLADDDGKWVKIPQLGRVVLGNDVEVGTGAAIDRGALDDTILADGVKLDNQVHIAHNVRIGEHTAIAAGVGIAGSSIIGAHCMVAGMCGINGHIELADHVHISGMTAVTRSIQQAGRYTGTIPIMSHRTWRKNFIRLKQLDDITRRLEKLENSSS
jgi:UDP-3-O-[3-hydroxymyristoyl] glucosamine N-acyltransferase